jgi:hypothetical protein
MRIQTRRSPERARLRSRSGFAMPLTMLVLVVLAIGLTGGLTYVTSERRVIDNTTMQEDAFLIAQAGLDEFLSNRSGLGFSGMPGATESVTLDILDGEAEVVLERLRPQVDDDAALYVVRSTGVVPGPRTQDPDARRTVAQLAEWESATMEPNAGWTSLTGLHKNGTSGTISGEDRCGTAPDVAGVSVPDPPGFSKNGNFHPDGTPELEEWPSVDDLIDDIGIDWEGIVDQTALTPDVVIPGDSWPSFPSGYWPVIFVTGDFSLPGTGRGVLIVTGGSLTISGNKTWEGIVLVGEHLTSNGNNKVYGTVYTGLDAILQDDPQAWAEDIGQNSLGNGNKTYQYDSCMIESAMTSFGGLRVIDNAWMDNWPPS